MYYRQGVVVMARAFLLSRFPVLAAALAAPALGLARQALVVVVGALPWCGAATPYHLDPGVWHVGAGVAGLLSDACAGVPLVGSPARRRGGPSTGMGA